MAAFLQELTGLELSIFLGQLDLLVQFLWTQTVQVNLKIRYCFITTGPAESTFYGTEGFGFCSSLRIRSIGLNPAGSTHLSNY